MEMESKTASMVEGGARLGVPPPKNTEVTLYGEIHIKKVEGKGCRGPDKQ